MSSATETTGSNTDGKNADAGPRGPAIWSGQMKPSSSRASSDIISMPDKWEYPWYAAWDLAFHTVALGMVDMDFAISVYIEVGRQERAAAR